MDMTRQSTTTQPVGDVIALYPFDRPDAARRHDGEVGGRVHLDDETGVWTVYGDPQRVAADALAATSTTDLLTKAYLLTHRLHEADLLSSKGNSRGIGPSEPNRRKWRRDADDLRAQRDLITAEVLRRTGDQA